MICVYKAHNKSSLDSESHLKLIEFVEPGAEQPSVCAALWRHGSAVHLFAPALRDGQSASLLSSVLGWLDAACFAASDPKQVTLTCAANPEWRLRCLPFDGSDDSLRALGELIRDCRRTRPPA